MHVVWFKRDLRIHDHAPLFRASQAGPVLPLYVIEPDFWQQPDASERHYNFLCECLTELQSDLAGLGQPLLIEVGDVIDVLSRLHRTHPITKLWSHEETGNGWTYARDVKVAGWCKEYGVLWQEERQNGVIRRMKSRDGWARAWDKQMAEPCVAVPNGLPKALAITPKPLPTATDLNLENQPCQQRQTGGRTHAKKHLFSFLEERGENYRKAMSSPVAGATACSRISPYLAFGSLSPREGAQATWARQKQLKEQAKAGERVGSWRGAMKSFSGRLHWRCHFMQKLEDEPALEYHSLHRAYDNLRPRKPDQTLFDAWAKGETGLPFVDACMRSLIATGWLNFRMRAMLMAFASYHLWLDWRATGNHMAQLFTDYEPGIHWPQVQMQSGVTGINAIRIYNPVKQGYDQDPSGDFIRHWVPELADIDPAFVHEPWLGMDRTLDRQYPKPIVDHLVAAREAKQKIWAVKRTPAFRDEAGRVLEKHGSRKNDMREAAPRKKQTAQKQKAAQQNPNQLSLL